LPDRYAGGILEWMRHAEQHAHLSVEEYLAFEQASPVRHEYAAGKIFAMAGSSEEHNRIALNIASRLLGATRGGPCRVFMSDMKVRVDEVFYYPDVLVTCEPDDDHRYYKERPSVVFEVLSDATEVVDRGEKLHNLRRLPSLAAYVLVSQDARRVEVYRRQAGGRDWSYGSYEIIERPDESLRLEQPEVRLTLVEIYEGLSPATG
jgi:Uma2 family endonuclease